MLRFPCLLLIALFPVAAMPCPSPANAAPDGEANIVRGAALALTHVPVKIEAHRLARTHGVRSAGVGKDGRTLTLTFSDGTRGAILPSMGRSEQQVRHPSLRSLMAPRAPTGRRALVLEPFATQLNLGSRAGDIEVADLEYAGYQVDQAYDGQVSVESMASLSRYSVVYMLTHSGVNEYGEGVVATGQLVNGDPEADKLILDHSVWKVGIVGSDAEYYGVLSSYIRQHLDTFPQRALVFINGCMLLRASLFWNALSDKGVAAMVSWDYDGMARDDSSSAVEFFGAMVRGASVAEAMDSVRAAGLGVSSYEGQPAHMGFVGDASLRLRDQISQPPATPTETVRPTATPGPTDTAEAPLATPLPDPSPTPQLEVVQPACRNSVFGASPACHILLRVRSRAGL